ncbi:MAG: N-acetyltransferase [Alphaproteobacteria bacterium]
MIGKLRRAAGEMGLGNALLYSLDQGCQGLGLPCRVRRYLFVAQPVPDRPLLPPSRGQKISVRPVEPGSAALNHLPLTENVARARFAQGALCLGAFKGDAVIGCAWLAFDGYDEDEVRSRFVPEPATRTAWDFDVYVVPPERMGLALMKLWDEANALLRRRGVRWSMSRISAFNMASLASHRRLGAKVVASAVYLTAGPIQASFISVAPYVHLSFGARGGPVIRLRAPDETVSANAYATAADSS